MSIVDVYEALGIQYQTEGHKHCRPGWVNTPCPFCTGNPGLHLGAHVASGRFYCWRCGWKPTTKAIATLAGISEKAARDLVRQYRIRQTGSTTEQKADQKVQIKPHKLPTPHGRMGKVHRQYLASRGFDPDHLENEWHLLGTGPVSFLDGIDYKNRILIPIFWNDEQVSFQTRAISDTSKLRYISCPKAREKVQHQRILYGKTWDRSVGICVEGVTDVWRFGPPAFGIFGIEFSTSQVRIMAQLFTRIIIIFDDDPQAIRQAKLLKAELQFRGVDAHHEEIVGDPGGMAQSDANYLVKQLTK